MQTAINTGELGHMCWPCMYVPKHHHSVHTYIHEHTHADTGTPILMDSGSAHVPADGHMDVFTHAHTHTHPDAWDVTNLVSACTDHGQGCLRAI